MWVRTEEYLKLLNNLQYYLKLPLEYVGMFYSPSEGKSYPVGRLDDVELQLNHYENIEDAEEKWNKRLERLNMDNLFVMMHTTNCQVLEEFDRLPYSKKVCFVPFESPLQSACTIQMAQRKEFQDLGFGKFVNRTASGLFHYYDLIKLLLEGTANHDRYYITKND